MTNSQVVELRTVESFTVSYGVKELSEALMFFTSLANLVGQNKNISGADYLKFLSLLPVLIPAIDNISQVPLEIRDLSVTERQLLVSQLSSTLLLPKEDVALLLVNGLDLILGFIQYINQIKALKK